MPIEPSSVSSSTIREVEKPSQSFGSWTSMQGSSTGGKDSPANRIWEKAISGAQKLFGLDSSKSSPLEDSSESEDNSEESAKQRYETASGGASRFASQSYGGYSGTAFGGDTFGSVVTSRAAADPQGSQQENSAKFETSMESDKPEYVAKEKVSQGIGSTNEAQPSKEKLPVEDLGEEEEVKEEKPLLAVVPRATQRSLAVPVSQTDVQQSSLPAEQAVLQGANQKGSGSASVVVAPQAVQVNQGLNSVPVDANASSNPQFSGTALPTQSTSKQISTTTTSAASTSVQTPVAPQETLVSQTSAQAMAKVQTQQPGESPAKGQGLPAFPQEVAKPAGTGVQEGKVLGQVSNPVTDQLKTAETPVLPNQGTPLANTQSESQNRPASSEATGLGFDVSKAKEAVSDGLAKATAATSVTSKPNAVQAQGVNPQTSGQVASQVDNVDMASRPLAGESFASRPGLTGTADGKEQSLVDGVKRDVSSAVEGRSATSKSTGIENTVTARVASSGSEGVAVDAKSVQSGASTSAGANQFARETATAAAARMQGPATPNSLNGQTATQQSGLSGVTSTQGTNVSSNGAQQGGSQNSSSGDPGAKKDFSEVLKQTSTGKGTEKLTSDGGQSFEAKVDEMTGRRTEASSKARQTSYVSKTAEEVKEVVATLTKSIDRLVTNKAGAMSLKINFEGGGSVNLRISMESGQVSTSMQTDVVGLEAAIKANWGELANDWNQKGVKLNTPQFQNSDSGKPSSFSDFNDFASKQDRQAGGQNGDGRGRSSGGQGSFTRGFSSSAASESSESILPNAEARGKVVSNKELKTYA